MAFTVVFFDDFVKKFNSTKRPDDTVTNWNYDVNLKDGTDIMNPTLLLSLEGELRIGQVNYCYISRFNRYYYIDSIVWNGPFWEFTCRIDVLATYREALTNDTMYISRTSDTRYINPKLMDGMFPADNVLEYHRSTTRMPTTTDGTYIVGVIGGGSILSKVGGAVCYYAMDYNALSALMAYLFDTDNFPEITTSEIAHTFFNPIQYISSAKWVPFSVGDAAVTRVRFGWWTTANIPCKLIQAYTYRFTLAQSLVISHPYPSDLSDYRNAAPYASYKLYIPYCGEYELPTPIIQQYTHLQVQFVIDPVSGDIIGEVGAGNGAEFQWANRRHVMFFQSNASCDVQLAQGLVDKAQILESSAKAAQSVFQLNLAGALGGVFDALQAAQPTVSKLGGNGSRALGEIWDLVTLYCFYRNVNTMGTASLGRPCGKRMKINQMELGSYVKATQSEVTISGTSSEMNEINSLVEEGIFYE